MACVLRWVGGGRGQGSVRVFGAGDLDQGVHITNTHRSATLTDHGPVTDHSAMDK